jgi:riboflavin-specific deaminase-like protein
MKANLNLDASKRPFVFINMAMSADGKIATANRAVVSFGSPRDHEHLLELRATADAVMAGAKTVATAGVNLGPGTAKFRRRRVQTGLAENNVRVIVSGRGLIHPRAEIFQHRFSPILILTTDRIPARRLKRLRELADEVRIFGREEMDFPGALRWLREDWGVKRLACEGGAELNDALFRGRLVDELHVTICPNIFGGRNAPTLADGTGAPRLAEAAGFQIKSLRRVGNELFAVFEPERVMRDER